MITKEQFKAAAGYDPQNDDLKRVNCPEAGKLGHKSCGWCKTHNCPVFDCACEVIRNEDNSYTTKTRFF